MSQSLRVLFVAPYVPSPVRVRPYHLLRGLVERGHAVTLVCAGGPADTQALAELRPLCAASTLVAISPAARAAAYLRAAAGDLPLQAAHCLAPAMVAAVRAELRRGTYDSVHIEHMRAAEVVRIAAAGVTDGPPLLLDAVDSISLLFERALRHSPSPRARAMALLDLARTRRYEAAYANSVDHVTLTSPEDRWAVATLCEAFRTPPVPLTVLPNGVDLDYFAPREVVGDPETIIFSGKMSYHANEAAARFLLRAIMPLVWRERPTARVVLAGAQPGPDLQRYGRDPRVLVTGYVPDLRPYLAGAAVAVAPIRYGVGVQNKVLEALAMGLPVVAARQATVALGARPGTDLLVADDAVSFAAAILELLANPARRTELGRAGRAYVERAHSWGASIALLETCYRSAHAAMRDRTKRIVSEERDGFTTVLERPSILSA